MMQVHGLVRKIIPQSTVDGLGNRFAVFLQGCNIRCAYCHNPETQSLHDDEAQQMSVDQIIEQLMKAMPFVRGITVSGGECMLQAKFIEALFEQVKNLGLSCLIDSNGTIQFSDYPRLMQLTDGVMLDVKAWNDDIYARLTGHKTNQIVKQNLTYLVENHKLTEVRIVCLPTESIDIKVDVNNILLHISEIRQIVDEQIPIYLIRFRNHGVIGPLHNAPMPTNNLISNYMNLAKSLHLNVRVK